ncbi:hypothetical protein [Rubritalea tangerina]|uniref:Uncharacterized protein n=1 Tax=Rubritalea tangerina TaxID=430798 RepID=A0ABW4Z7N2_9BACT
MILNTFLIVFLIFWFLLGAWLVSRYNVLFGPHKDDPAESPGARSFGVAHIVAVWIGGAALAIYFLVR